MTSLASQSARPLRMAVIGCGPIGGLHAQAIQASPLASLVAVCDPDAERRTAMAEPFRAAAYDNAGQLLAEQKLDAVTIATPDHLHVEPALAAIEAGCHVFCEKPLATEVHQAERLVRAAAERGVHLAVDYNRRFAFGYRTARQQLEQGSIGKLDYIILRVSDRTPRAEVARNPHVMFTTLLTHHLDLMRFYGGEIRRLHALAGDEPAAAPEPVSKLPGEGDSPILLSELRKIGTVPAVSKPVLMRSVTLSLQFAGGAVGAIVAGYRDEQARTSEWLELGGTAGSLVVEDITRRVILCGPDPDRPRTFEPNPFGTGAAFYDSLVQHVQAFIEQVARGQQPPVTGRDGLVGMQWAAAAVESLRSGQAVEI
jgi:UDP-N-acetylglucosamine 3-dehydrogenase